MVWIPAPDNPRRTFLMGSDDGYPEEAPAREVPVVEASSPVGAKGFWIDATEVTNRQFAAFVAATGYITLANWLSALVALAGYLLLIPRWLGYGAAVATLMAFSVRLTVTYRISQRLWPIRYQWRPVWRLVLLAAAVYLTALWIPKGPLSESLALRGSLFGSFLLLVWFADVIPADDLQRIRARITWSRNAVPEVPEEVAGGMGAESSGNWVWLAAPARWDRVLVVGGSPLHGIGLADHFAAVHRLATGRDADLRSLSGSPLLAGPRAIEARGDLAVTPYLDASFDCIVLHRALSFHRGGGSSARTPGLRVLQECFRLLRPGGCVYIASANPVYFRTLLGWLSADVFSQVVPSGRSLRQTGFRQVCTYYADPSIDQPWSVVPATPDALRVLERHSGAGAGRARLRVLIAAAGLSRLIHPWTIHLAYK
jgi:SAM-dependent methyltransferase